MLEAASIFFSWSREGQLYVTGMTVCERWWGYKIDYQHDGVNQKQS